MPVFLIELNEITLTIEVTAFLRALVAPIVVAHDGRI